MCRPRTEDVGRAGLLLRKSLRLGCCLLAVSFWLAPRSAHAANTVSENGSRVADSSRSALAALNTNYSLTSNSDLIIYAAGVNDSGCRIKTGKGGHSP